ncbi:MAG TPA: TatD family hydrolase [Verrucomicrobiales bacterium]|nr:TatD family hydrolase [Verrucomicrobiales bacterium]
MTGLTDCHNHLQDPRLAGHAEEVLRDCRAAGVSELIVNGTRESDWPNVAALARRFPGQVRASYGLHPWYAAERSLDWGERLAGFLDGGACGVGEAGLDRWIPGHDIVDQSAILTAQIAMARERGLPLTLHCLQAWGVLLALLERSSLPARGFLLHSYGGSPEMVDGFVRLGAYFSFSGYFLRPGKEAKLEAFRRAPLDRLLVETDAPDMALPPELERFHIRGENGKPVNHPANLPAVLEGLARLRGVGAGELASAVAANCRRLFG